MAGQNMKLGETTYTFGMLPPSKAIPVQVAVARVIGEPLFQLFTESKKGSPEEQQQKALSALALIAAKMDPVELTNTMRAVVENYTSANDKRIVDIDSTFQGKNKELWQVFIGALRYNFSDFFPEGLLDSSLNAASKSN